ncbi:MAG: hypothetical protein GYA51_17990, partial [Candidatus Methanofastidiosa archaeon]|nr:hypothetical protein [Candidatus Methanofastidiosa archaeon]
MESNFCDICNSDLFLDYDNGFWCPNCEDIESIGKFESLQICKTIINELNAEIDIYCKDFSYNHLLEAANELREHDAKTNIYSNISFGILDIIKTTLLIKRILDGSHGIKTKKDYQLSLRGILETIHEIVEAKNSKVLISEDHGQLFPFSEVKHRTKNLELYSHENKEYYVFIHKAHWKQFIENLENEANVASISRIHELKNRPPLDFNLIKNDRIKPPLSQNIIRFLEMAYNSFYLLYYDSKLFEFPEIELNNQSFAFFNLLYRFAYNRFQMLTQNRVVRITLEEFNELAKNVKINPKKAFNMFVSFPGNVHQFPIMIYHKNNIIIPPDTMFMLTAFFDYKLHMDEYGGLKEGKVFEIQVEEELKRLGFKFDDPNQKGLFLRNRNIKYTDDKGKLQPREIDRLAYKNSCLLVIECKDKGPTSKFIYKRERKNRVQHIKEEIDGKHVDRVK